MKGKSWYRKPEIAEEYDLKRFEGEGGSYIDKCEKNSVGAAIGNFEGKKILDLAAGTGRFSIMAAQKGAYVTSCDISKPMLEIAYNKAKERGVESNIDFIRADAENLPLKDSSFDVVMAIRFMHLVDEPSKYLKEMKRVSKDKILFDTFSFSSFRILYNRLLPMGSKLYSDEEVNDLAKKCNLNIMKKLNGFAVPFAVYRYSPDFIIGAFQNINEKMLNIDLGRKLSSVNYWVMEKDK